MADRKSREGSWKHGWPSVIAVVALMSAAGFAVGVIAGIGWEEPGLVVGYLTGKTEEIGWGAGEQAPEVAELEEDGAAAEVPSVAAPPPLGLRKAPDSGPAERAPRPEGAAAERPERAAAKRDGAPPVAQPTGRFAVQVGAFSEKRAAQALADSLRAHGYPVYLSPTEGDPPNWRVRVGPLPTRPEAEKAARKLETAEKLPTWVLGEDS